MRCKSQGSAVFIAIHPTTYRSGGFLEFLFTLKTDFQAEILGHSASPPLNGHKKRALRLGGI